MAATSSDLRELASFLVNCSKTSLADYYLKRLDQAAHLERDLRDVARALVDTLASVELAAFLRDYGEEIISNPSRADTLPAGPRSAHADRSLLPFSASNWFELQDAVVEKALSGRDLLICMAIARSVNQEGWATLKRSIIAARADCTEDYLKVALRELQDRHVIERRGAAGEMNRYRIRPKTDWRAATRPKLVKEKKTPTRTEARMSLSAKGCQLWAPNLPPMELGAGTVLRIEDEATETGVIARLSPGSSSIRVPSATVWERIAIAHGEGEKITPSPLSEETRVGEGGGENHPLPPPLVPELGGEKITPSPQLGTNEHQVGVQTCDGLVLVTKRKDRRLWTAPEERAIKPRGGEAVAEFFVSKGFGANFRRRELPKLDRMLVTLDRGPSSVWDEVKARIEKVLDAHTFTTWFRPTREIGEWGGHTVIVVPSSPHQKRLRETHASAIRSALTAIGESQRIIDYLVEDRIEIVQPRGKAGQYVNPPPMREAAIP